MISFLQKLLGQRPAQQNPGLVGSRREDSVKRIIFDKDDDFEWARPPVTIADAAAWDKYWSDLISHGFTPTFFDLMNNSGDLAAVMTQFGMRSVLCG